MSHVKLQVLVSTDGADFAERLELLGPTGLMHEQLAALMVKMAEGRHSGVIFDANGNSYGRWDMSEVRD